MPLVRPTHADTTAPPPFTIGQADVTGMTPGRAHEAILGAFDAGITTAHAAAGMVDQPVIDTTVAELTTARTVCTAHAPYSLVAADTPVPDGVWCLEEGTCGPPWPCPAYLDAAATIADGLR